MGGRSNSSFRKEPNITQQTKKIWNDVFKLVAQCEMRVVKLYFHNLTIKKLLMRDTESSDYIFRIYVAT